jgi:hypothetical protein
MLYILETTIRGTYMATYGSTDDNARLTSREDRLDISEKK